MVKLERDAAKDDPLICFGYTYTVKKKCYKYIYESPFIQDRMHVNGLIWYVTHGGVVAQVTFIPDAC